jgi:hypothetical protein
MRGRAAVLTIMLLGGVNLAWAMQAVVQTAPASQDWTSSIEHLTLNAALICAVGVLWKQLGKKDELLIASTQTVTQTLAAAAASNVELRRIIDESVGAKRALTQVIDDLQVSIGKLPCAVPIHHGKGQE